MADVRREFLRFAIDGGVLKFGRFELKSGRISPYFFNAGLFNSGASLARLGSFYAAAALASGLDFDMLFGPAYKGIPLVSATAVALAREHDRDVPWCFDRKEAKTHGEGGMLVGAPARGRVLIVDDVITAGTAIRDSVAKLRAAGAVPTGVLVALDRQERGQGEESAISELARELDLTITSIAGLDDLVSLLSEDPQWREHARSVREYRENYGI